MAKIKYYGQMAVLAGTKEEVLLARNLSALLRVIKAEHGAEAAKKARHCHIVVNGRNAGVLRGFATPLTEEDEVIFMPVCGGG